ncbi:MAG: RecQ family zinc-binding domain-containing protein, partial [Candidatus Margulisiibacteriota bacterium]
FNLQDLTGKLAAIFKEKEMHEIERIQKLVDFFESDTCLTQRLSAYFGEQKNAQCNHCSVCETGKIKLPVSKIKAIPENLFAETMANLRSIFAEDVSPIVVTKFLCGITTPVLAKAKLTRHENFGLFENYRFHDVLAKVILS